MKESFFIISMDEMKTSQAGCDISAVQDTVASRTCLRSSTTAIFTTEHLETSPPEQSCWCGMTKNTLNTWVSHLKYVKPPLDLLSVRSDLWRGERERGGGGGGLVGRGNRFKLQ